jgi:hypothetical protein
MDQRLLGIRKALSLRMLGLRETTTRPQSGKRFSALKMLSDASRQKSIEDLSIKPESTPHEIECCTL